MLPDGGSDASPKRRPRNRWDKGLVEGASVAIEAWLIRRSITA
jgi:hypothetical protein